MELSFLGLGQSQTNQDGWSPYSGSPVSGTFWSQQEPLVPHPLWSLGLVGGVPGKDTHKPPFLGLLPLSGWSEWSPCGPCLPLGLLAPASRTALEERWPQDTAGLFPTSAPTLASEQHRHRLCLDPETGRPWAGDPDLCTVPLSQQRLCPDPGACQGDGGAGPRGAGNGRGLVRGGAWPGRAGLRYSCFVGGGALSWLAHPPARLQGLLDLRLGGGSSWKRRKGAQGCRGSQGAGGGPGY